MSVSLSVPEAALALGVSERTVWRQIRDGRLPVIREGRLVRVLIEPGATRGRAVRETPAAYGSAPTSELTVGPWPFTAENVARQRERLRQRRLAALEEIKRIAATTKPDPDGLTILDYLRDEDDPPPGEGCG
ncbi:MAG: helix-turn-helix domain-containing protein [Chloroflexota bacterium]